MKTSRFPSLLFLAIVLAAGLASPAALSGGRETKLDSLGQEIVSLVREKFYDPKAAEAWAAAHDHYGAKADGRDARSSGSPGAPWRI